MSAPVSHRFQNRFEAGLVLARKLDGYRDRPDALVLALPRGGVPVAFKVADLLHLPLDVFLVRKLGLPGQPELAMGAIATGGILVLNDEVVRMLGVPREVIERVASTEQQELARREEAYRGSRPAPQLRNRTVILVDDGLATGSTMKAAARAIKQQEPTRLVIAVPTAPPEVCEALRHEADEVVCVMTPEPFDAVGLWYVDFSQTSDEEVRALLARAAEGRAVHH